MKRLDWNAFDFLKSVWVGNNPILGQNLEIMASKLDLVKKGDVIKFDIGKGAYSDLDGDIIFATVFSYDENLEPTNVRCWKFVPTEQMINDDNFDTMDWRTELDDKKNLSIWNFFLPRKLSEFLEMLWF